MSGERFRSLRFYFFPLLLLLLSNAGLKVVDVVGWAPTMDGLYFGKNSCQVAWGEQKTWEKGSPSGGCIIGQSDRHECSKGVRELLNNNNIRTEINIT